MMTEVLLKARPMTEQLADRRNEPEPEGLELYLAPADLGEDPGVLVERARGFFGGDFHWIVEAPIRTLGGQYFDLTSDDADHRETLRRVVAVGRALGAVAANVHIVAPTRDLANLTQTERRRRLDAALGLLRYYVALCRDANLVPQVENVPPVGRMRESAFVFSAIGADPDDLLALAAAEPAIRFTVDTSHAGLYLNWCRRDPPEKEFARVATFFRDRYRGEDLTAYCGRLAERTFAMHVSNASGHFGEGEGYLAGEFDLDAALGPLVGRVPFFVTETLEEDPNRAVGMRDAQRRLRRLIAHRSIAEPRNDAAGVAP